MTLIVSLRIPDGIVLAGDSLSTLPTQAVPTKLSYRQKIFPFCGKFGVGTFGADLLAETSVYFSLRLFEERLKQQPPKGATEIARKVGTEFHNLLVEQLRREDVSVDALPAEEVFLGFQVVGYDESEPRTVEVLVGKEVRFHVLDKLGCTVSGNREIVQVIWDLSESSSESSHFFPPVTSLQDAIDYAEFLIRTTIDYQRFSPNFPNVGGDIDIALVTPFDGFRWIRQNSLGGIRGGK